MINQIFLVPNQQISISGCSKKHRRNPKEENLISTCRQTLTSLRDVKIPLVMEGSIMIKLLPKWNKGYEEFAQCSPLGQELIRTFQGSWFENQGKQMMLQSAISSLSITAILPRSMGGIWCDFEYKLKQMEKRVMSSVLNRSWRWNCRVAVQNWWWSLLLGDGVVLVRV
ncbi:hypothetical protein MKW98_014788 [Papaver atlanticum]|uniref:Uncharacterized protein n=1 Tax=Papaver atlanticum TaxID=357466 RepID=A0AAD4XDX8_9MAGN|nr:hypothetical protein MKW98_014788 [Papaver atlanticum]